MPPNMPLPHAESALKVLLSGRIALFWTIASRGALPESRGSGMLRPMSEAHQAAAGGHGRRSLHLLYPKNEAIAVQ